MEKHDSRDWQAGDLALCINTEGWTLGFVHHHAGPPPGSVSLVTAVGSGEVEPFGPVTWLWLESWGSHPWDGESFVKVSPPALDAEVLREELYEDRTQ